MDQQKSVYPQANFETAGNYPHPQPPPAYDQSQQGQPYPQTNAPYAASMPAPQPGGPPIVHHTIMANPPVGPDPTVVVCPSCRQQIVTRLDYETSTRTHIMAALLCAFVCWPCAWIPYVMDSCKNGNHYCPNCGCFIGTYKS